MVQVRKDMTGWKMWEHGVPDSRLTVIKQVEDYIDPNGKHRTQWLCKCSCEEHNEIIVAGRHLTNGAIKSCGCLQKESRVKVNIKNNILDMESENYGIGYTLKGEPFWFDKEDVEVVKKYCWYYNNDGYLVARERGTDKFVLFHRLIMEPISYGMVVDHKKHPPRHENKYDNRKSNLEIKTHSQNNMNLSLSVKNKSGITGVSWNEQYNKWDAYITTNYQRIYLGRFDIKEDAIKARKNAEITYFGEYRYDVNN